MIMYIGVMHIWDHVLQGKKATEWCGHEAPYTEVCQTELRNFGHGTINP